MADFDVRCRKPKTLRRTKIVATLGPASSSPEVIRQLILAGMDVARLNFSHGEHADHARTVSILREISREIDSPVTILQDLQGPKVRVGCLPRGEIALLEGEIVALIPEADFDGQSSAIPIDYAHAAEEAVSGMPVLLADGLFELKVESVLARTVHARVIHGGLLKSRKSVNFPALDLRLPSLTPKDEKDLDFGLAQGVDAISLSFVRSAQDIRILKDRIESRGFHKPVIAKIEKPQAVNHLDDILNEARGVMVARGDLGVEMSPEKVPMLQKRIIEQCNRRGLPVITATQMLESMIHEPRPTRAEASDVANAIIDGTDAVMLSGETAVGAHPALAVEMMARISAEVESAIVFKSYPPAGDTQAHGFSRAVKALEGTLHPKCTVAFSHAGSTALAVAAERLKSPVVVLTREAGLYHALNLVWGIRPVMVEEEPETAEGLVALAATTSVRRGFAACGDQILVLGEIPSIEARGAKFVTIQTVS
jgi:pyruvate kinase